MTISQIFSIRRISRPIPSSPQGKDECGTVISAQQQLFDHEWSEHHPAFGRRDSMSALYCTKDRLQIQHPDLPATTCAGAAPNPDGGSTRSGRRPDPPAGGANRLARRPDHLDLEDLGADPLPPGRRQLVTGETPLGQPQPGAQGVVPRRPIRRRPRCTSTAASQGLHPWRYQEGGHRLIELAGEDPCFIPSPRDGCLGALCTFARRPSG
jgi:hypothetical protein